MFCTACGFEQSPNDLYCARCGRPSGSAPPRRLIRSLRDRKIAGVCAGFAHYFGMDVTIMRILWIVLFFLTGIPIIAYPICWIVMPSDEARPGPATYQQAT
jgi:phage shock protein C